MLAVAFFAPVFCQPSAAQESKTKTLAAEKDAKANPIKRIVDRMHSAQSRLNQGDTGAGTRALQERVVSDLQALINSAKQSSKRENEQSASNSPEQTSAEKPSQPQQQEKSDAASRPIGGPDPGKRPRAGTPPASKTTASPASHRPLLHEVWGHLPPALRERVSADFSETILPAYDDLVRRYFEALLDESSGPGTKPPLK